MDDFFKIFLTKFGPPFHRDEAPASSITRYREKLPNQLLVYWEKYGWGGYADGLFWIVNPQDYEPIVKEWVDQNPAIAKDTYHVIARNAFGGLHLWGERTERILTIDACWALFSYMTSGLSKDMCIRSFFAILDVDHCDPQELFQCAMDRLGRLRNDEMYAFVPALALGGVAQAKSLDKVTTVEHLLFLSQLEPLRQIASMDV